MTEHEALERECAHLRRQLATIDESLTNATEEILRLRKIEAVARNLVAQKGRHRIEQAYSRLAELLVQARKG
jgi:DNA-binding FrmR family transcriptional regulator